MGEAPHDPNGYKNGSTKNLKRWLGSLLVEQNVQLKRWLGSLFFEQNVQSKAVLRTTLRTISNDINRFWHAPKDVTYINFCSNFCNFCSKSNRNGSTPKDVMTWFKIAGTFGGHDPEKIITPLIFVHFSCAFDRRWLNSCTF